MIIRKSDGAKGEEQPWRALANAVIVQAVKDYRSYAKMIRQIRARLKRHKCMPLAETVYQEQRLMRYLGAQDILREFFFSPSFYVLSDLDGRRLLERLDQEVI